MAEEKKGDIGIVGLAVMGANLALNMESRGFTVSVYNRTFSKTEAFVKGVGKGHRFIETHDFKELCQSLKKPRKVFLMVMAGPPVDETFSALLPFLEAGDIVIDGGNSHFSDTERRVKEADSHGILFVGCGVSGGEEGALKGPSLMPGGNPKAWEFVKPILQSIAAIAPEDNSKCCDWIGNGGAGHFAKMVHNGIEYGDMQLIAEAFHMLKSGGLSHKEISGIFAEWNKTDLSSFLIEITAEILLHHDNVDSTHNSGYTLDSILDVAEQKGTGKWTGQEALERGVPVTTIVEAVFARHLSSLKQQRMKASTILSGPATSQTTHVLGHNKNELISMVHDSVWCAKLISYAQGFALMKSASEAHGWNLNFGAIAMTWRNGCIIRSSFLGDIRKAFEKEPTLPNLLISQFFVDGITKRQQGWREACSNAILAGIPIPATSSALAYYDGYRCENLPANLLQAQRDFFGAHMYERIDYPRGKWFHTNWSGQGGTITSTPPSH